MTQTVSNWEAIIVDDQSSDNSLSIARQLASRDPRLVCVSKAHSGLSATRNAGLDLIRGRYVQFLDSDDVLLPTKFEKQLATIPPGATHVVSVTDYKTGSHDNLTAEPFPPLPLAIEPGISLGDFIARWETTHSVPCHSFLFSADFFTTHRIRFQTDLRNHEDFECWVRVLCLDPCIVLVPEPLAIYRQTPNSMSRDPLAMYNGFIKALNLLLANPKIPRELHAELRRKKIAIAAARRRVVPVIKGVSFAYCPWLGWQIKHFARSLRSPFSRNV